MEKSWKHKDTQAGSEKTTSFTAFNGFFNLTRSDFSQAEALSCQKANPSAK
jgi:hypothetical protein